MEVREETGGLKFGKDGNEDNSAGNNCHDEREVGEQDGYKEVWTILPVFSNIYPIKSALFIDLWCRVVLISDCSTVLRWHEAATLFYYTCVNLHHKGI